MEIVDGGDVFFRLPTEGIGGATSAGSGSSAWGLHLKSITNLTVDNVLIAKLRGGQGGEITNDNVFADNGTFANQLLFSCFGLTMAVPSALVALHILFRQIPAKLNRQCFDWGQGVSVSRDCDISQPAQNDLSAPPPRNLRRGPVDEISAIQILRKHYIKRGLEVNLVLESGARVNIVKSERGHYAMTQAKKLADFLDVVIWNESSRGVWEFRSKMTVQSQGSREAIAKNMGALLLTIWFSITRQYDRVGHWEWVPSASAHAPVSQA